MDYPHGVPGVGLVNGKFVDENQSVGQAGSLIPAVWGNAVTEEILNVQLAGGQNPDETKNNQLLLAIRSLIRQIAAPLYSMLDLPQENVGPITIRETGEVWLWSQSAYYTGYRSLLCGRPIPGHTVSPLVSEIDAAGGLVPKASYPQLWAYARENGLVVTQAVWSANVGAHWFVDVDANNFRVPDLRHQFIRLEAGANDADTANARALGSWQKPSVVLFDPEPSDAQIAAVFSATGGAAGIGLETLSSLAPYPGLSALRFAPSGTLLPAALVNTGAVRPANVAFFPRIHV